MEKTISITLNNQSFIIEEDAYNKLAHYLENIKSHCGAGVDAAEVITDIENSMAEKLKSNLSPYKEVINLADVESLITIMGTAEDFDREVGDSNNKKEETSETKIERKLYRDTDAAIIGGVAAGLGNYFNIDPVLIRVIFLVLIFAGGSGFLIYILLWIAMPEAKTAHQKLEMKGQAPTLAAFKNLAQTGKKIQDNLKKNSITEKVINFPVLIIKAIFTTIKNVWNKLWPIIKFFFGLGLTVLSFIFLGAIGVGALFMLLYNNTTYQISFIPINELTNLLPYTWIVITGFLSLAIPATIAFILGLSILFKKNILNLATGLILLIIWMGSGVFFCASSLRYFPEIQNKIDNYPLTQEKQIDLDLQGVKNIEVAGDVNVLISASTSTPATLSGRQVDLNYIELNRQGDKLIITEKEQPYNTICLDCKFNRVDLQIASSSEIKIKTSEDVYLETEVLEEDNN